MKSQLYCYGDATKCPIWLSFLSYSWKVVAEKKECMGFALMAFLCLTAFWRARRKGFTQGQVKNKPCLPRDGRWLKMLLCCLLRPELPLFYLHWVSGFENLKPLLHTQRLSWPGPCQPPLHQLPAPSTFSLVFVTGRGYPCISSLHGFHAKTRFPGIFTWLSPCRPQSHFWGVHVKQPPQSLVYQTAHCLQSSS